MGHRPHQGRAGGAPEGSLRAQSALNGLEESLPDEDERAGVRIVRRADRGAAALDRGRIFDPFFTTRFAGRGLGLAAVLGVLREIGAVILVDSRPREGSSFTVLFPTATPDGEATC